MKLLSNLPIEKLTPENDYLGVIEKGDMIVSLLKSGNIDFEEIKMFALYGNWGSGKSTLMKYMQSKLDDEFKTFYFDAWKYENGKDLSFSLLEFMTDEGVDKGEKVAAQILKTGKRVLIGSAKALKLGIPEVGTFSIKILIDELLNKPNPTFHTEIKRFKNEFKELEKSILAASKQEKKTNIVFIDDLDRCEPDKVLSLLSEIKLFFTYGERTIFFFGVDQKAVQIAIKTKYGEVVKSNEYLEKVFDLTFHLREDMNIKKMIYNVFPQRQIQNIGSGVSYQKYIYEFFSLLKLNNPRKLKKLINAYVIYAEIILSKKLNENHQLIVDEDNDGSFLNTIITLYLIACRLFYPDQFGVFCEPQDLKRILSKDNEVEHTKSSNVQEVLYDLDQFVSTCNYVGSIYHNLNEKEKDHNKGLIKDVLRINHYTFGRFAIVFAPLSTYNFKLSSLTNLNNFVASFSADKADIAYNMMWYLYSRIYNSYDLSKDVVSTISLKEIKSTIKEFL